MKRVDYLSRAFACVVLLAACPGVFALQTGSPEATAKAFVAAWGRNDRLAAAKLATATAVKQSFGARKSILDFRKKAWSLDDDRCKQDEKIWSCDFSWDIAGDLFLKVAKVGNDYKVTGFSWYLAGD